MDEVKGTGRKWFWSLKPSANWSGPLRGFILWKGRPVNFENYEKKWAKHVNRLALFAVGAILVFIAVLWLAPCLDIKEGGKISLSRMQLAYGLLSVLIAVALYVWGVGNWSRFEPPPDTPDKSPDPKTPPPLNAAQGAPLAAPPATPAPPKGGN